MKEKQKWLIPQNWHKDLNFYLDNPKQQVKPTPDWQYGTFLELQFVHRA